MKQIDSLKRIKLQSPNCKLCEGELENKAIEVTSGRTKDLVCEQCGKGLSQFLGIPISGIK